MSTRADASSVSAGTPTGGATVAYYRVSSSSQSIQMQRHAIQRAGVSPVREFADEGVSGRTMSRAGWDECLTYLRTGDELVVYSLSRLGRSTRAVLEALDTLAEREVRIRSITESLSTDTPMGRAMVAVLAVFNSLEREMLQEKTKDALAERRAAGVRLGRPRVLSTEQVRLVQTLHASGQHTIKAIAATVGCSRASIYRALSEDAV